MCVTESSYLIIPSLKSGAESRTNVQTKRGIVTEKMELKKTKKSGALTFLSFHAENTH